MTDTLIGVLALSPGDRIRGGDDGVPRTVLRPAEDGRDPMGQPIKRVWCRRDDTGEEGYASFGQYGLVYRLGPDPITGWREDELGVLDDAGDVGGDIQVGPAFSRRFVFGPVEGRYLVVEPYTYAARWGLMQEPEADPEYPYSVEEQTHYTICTDLEDVGGTEVSADIDYGEGSVFGYPTLDEATDEARRMIERDGLWTMEHYDPTEELRVGTLHRGAPPATPPSPARDTGTGTDSPGMAPST